MEKQATLKEKVNRQKTTTFYTVMQAAIFVVVGMLLNNTFVTSRPGQEMPNDHSCEKLVKALYRFSSHANCAGLHRGCVCSALLAHTIANINVIQMQIEDHTHYKIGSKPKSYFFCFA